VLEADLVEDVLGGGVEGFVAGGILEEDVADFSLARDGEEEGGGLKFAKVALVEAVEGRD
jgi:hypothetical protein